jgi:subtilisin family serine protease
MEAAWDQQNGTGPHVVVAVVDSGIDPNHADLQDAVNRMASYNFVENNNTIFDDVGHGTRVAGIIGASAGNGEGSVGIAHGCTLLSLDVATSVGTVTSADVASAINWAVAHQADVINLSLRFESFSQTLTNACNAADNAGSILVAAAGNENQSNSPVYPASLDSVIGVAATQDDGVQRAPFSNYNGTETSIVDLAAPGTTVFSTIPGSQYNGSYGSGTSFAAPMVSGVAALLKARHPGQSNAAIRAQLTRTATPLEAWAGAGRLNARAALETPMAPEIAVAGFEVDDDPSYSLNNDGDGALESGETVRLIVNLSSQKADALDVVGYLSAPLTEVEAIWDAQTAFGRIPYGETRSNARDPFQSIRIRTTPQPTVVTFSLTVVAGGGAFNKTLKFQVPVEREEQIAGTVSGKAFTADRTYVVPNDLQLTGDISIAPGTLFKLGPGVNFTLGSACNLKAQGTADHPIRFTSMKSYGYSQKKTGGTVTQEEVGPVNLTVDRAAYARIVYVDVERGSDFAGEDAGTTRNPFRTISFALNQVTGSDAARVAILVAGGAYGPQEKGAAAPNGNFYTVVMKPNVDLFGGYDGKYWRRDIEANPTILDAGNMNAVVYGADNARLDGFRVRNGRTLVNRGGGILCEGGSAAISNNVIESNYAELGGGGIACRMGSSPSIHNNRIAGNSTSDITMGGGILVEGSNPVVLNNLIVGNVSQNGAGIAVLPSLVTPVVPSTLSASDNIITANATVINGDGGGIYVEGSVLGLVNTIVSGNSSEMGGGGIFLSNSYSSLIQNCRVEGNASNNDGGGLYAFNSSVRAFNSVWAGNSAGEGGGMFCEGGGTVSLSNCVVVENQISSTSGMGGGIASGDSQTTLSVVNSVLRGNVPGEVLSDIADITYSNVEGDWPPDTPDTTNMDAEAGFVGPVAWGIVTKIDYSEEERVSTLKVQGLAPGRDSLAGQVVRIGNRAYVVKSNGEDTLVIWGDATRHLVWTDDSQKGTVSLPQRWTIEDYHLTERSECRERGIGPDVSSAIFATDVDGDPRFGVTSDIGVDEFRQRRGEIFSAWGEFNITTSATQALFDQCVFENGAGVYNALGNTSFSNCLFTRNTGRGLVTVAGETTLTACVANFNIGAGIVAVGYSRSLVNCEAYSNDGDGLVGRDLEGCVAENNTGDGLQGIRVKDGRALSNGGSGSITVGSQSNVTAMRNRGRRHTEDDPRNINFSGHGVLMTGPGSISNCTAIGNSGVGIEARDSNGTIKGCVSVGNGVAGILTEGVGVDDCIVRDNWGEGIWGATKKNTALSNSLVVGNAGAGVRNFLSVTNSSLADNGEGLSDAGIQIQGSYLGRNGRYGASGAFAVQNSTIIRNQGDGLINPTLVENCWILGNQGVGVRGKGSGTVRDSSILRNLQGGMSDIFSVTNSNLFDNFFLYKRGPVITIRKTFEAAYYSSMTAGDYTGNYWGTSNTLELNMLPENSNMAFIRDGYDALTASRLDIWPYAAAPVVDSPDFQTPAFLRLVTPNLDEHVYVGPVTFTLMFSKPMDQTLNPNVSFGTQAPYTASVVAPSPGWISPTVWQGMYSIQEETGETTNTLRVENARSADGFRLADDLSNRFYIETTPETGHLSANNGAALALGGGPMGLRWSENNPPAGSKGYDVQRSMTGAPGSYEKVNDVPVPMLGDSTGLRADDQVEFTDTQGLQPDTDYFYIVYLIDAGDNAMQWTPPFMGHTESWSVAAPAVVNRSPVGVDETVAVAGGTLTGNGGENPSVWLLWGETDGGTNPAAWQHSESLGTVGVGDFSEHLEGLTPGTQYFYRCRASNSAGDVWAASSETFTTPHHVDLPGIENQQATDITTQSVQFRGNVTSTGGEDPRIYLYWGLTDGATVPANWQHVLDMGYMHEGIFTTVTTGLLPGTRYYFRCYAVNSAGGTWASLSENFQTLTPVLLPSLQYLPVTDITTISAVVGLQVLSTGGWNPEVRVVWGTTDGGTDLGAWQRSSSMGTLEAGTHTRPLEGLTPGTQYFYRFLAENTAGKVWLNPTLSFQTQTHNVLSLQNDEATSVTFDSAVIGGALTALPNEEAEVAIYWGLTDGDSDPDLWDHAEYLGTRGLGDFSLALAGLTSGTTYFYRCYAEDDVVGVWASQTLSFTTEVFVQCDPPANLVASDGWYSDRVRLTWDAVPGALYYRVSRSDSEVGVEIELGPWQTALSFEDTQAVAGTVYYYSVSAAVNAKGDYESIPSETDSGFRPNVSDLKNYKVTYKNCAVSVFNGSSLDIQGATNQSTIKIVQMKPGQAQNPKAGILYTTVMLIPEIRVQGDLKSLYTQAFVQRLTVEGTLKGLTAKNTYVLQALATAFGTVSMQAAPDSTAFPEGEFYWTLLMANGSPVPSGTKPFNIKLAGVGARRIDIPGQGGMILAQTKKGYDKLMGETFLSISGLGTDTDDESGVPDPDPEEACSLKTGGPLSVSVSGADIAGMIEVNGDLKKMTATGLPVKALEDLFGGGVFFESLTCAGKIGVLSSTGADVDITALTAAGEIKSISSKSKTIKSYGISMLYGGTVRIADYVASGFNSTGQPCDIGLVYGSSGISGGSFYAGANVVEENLVPAYRGWVKLLKTQSANDLNPNPTIEGEAWTNLQPQFKGGNFSTFTVHLP